MTSEKYNGWINYETWLLNLWIDNEQGDYEYWREQTEQVCEHYLEDNVIDVDSAKRDLSDQLEQWLDEMAEFQNMPTNGFFADILNAAIKEVSFYEIVEHWIEEYMREHEELKAA